jgi:4a-hydroxytetrahydrobiopterin dehydratase
MLTIDQLLSRRCRPLEGHGALSAGDIAAQLKVVPEWEQRDGAIGRTFRFTDYYQTIAFVNALAFMVHREDHHPDLIVGYNRCEVRFNTHSVGGISENDFICAAKADAIFAQRYGTAAA